MNILLLAQAAASAAATVSSSTNTVAAKAAAPASLNAAVAAEAGRFNTFAGTCRDWLITNLPGFLVSVVVCIVICVVAWALIAFLRHVTRRALAKTRVAPLVSDFIVNVLSKACWVLVFLVCLGRLGVAVGPLVAGLGAAGFIAGFACQDALGNFASGAMIVLNQPFNIGDYVQFGSTIGTVSGISMMATTVTTDDNTKVIFPNKVVWGAAITNYTANATRRVDFNCAVAYGTDVELARKVAIEAMAAVPGVLKDPAPCADVITLKDSAVAILCRPWSKKEDFWPVYFAAQQAVQAAFVKHGFAGPTARIALAK